MNIIPFHQQVIRETRYTNKTLFILLRIDVISWFQEFIQKKRIDIGLCPMQNQFNFIFPECIYRVY